MRKTTLLLLFLLSFQMFRAQAWSGLRVASQENLPFRLYIDNYPVNTGYLDFIYLSGIPSGYHRLEFHFLKDNREITLSDRIYFPPDSEVILVAEVTNYDVNLYVSEIVPLGSGIYEGNASFSWNTVTGTAPNGRVQVIVHNENNVVHNTPAHAYVPGYAGAIGCVPPVSPGRFQQMLRAIKNKSFSDEKLALAKQIIRFNDCLTSAQLLEILRLFSFDDDKLELAKFAYHYIYDLENFYLVNEAFDFDSNVEELNRYIMSHPY